MFASEELNKYKSILKSFCNEDIEYTVNLKNVHLVSDDAKSVSIGDFQNSVSDYILEFYYNYDNKQFGFCLFSKKDKIRFNASFFKSKKELEKVIPNIEKLITKTKAFLSGDNLTFGSHGAFLMDIQYMFKDCRMFINLNNFDDSKIIELINEREILTTVCKQMYINTITKEEFTI